MAVNDKNRPLQIIKASELGFCFGVRRALKILQKAASQNKELSTLGPIVHNKRVVQEMAKNGVEVVNDIAQVHGNTVVLSSHGVSPALLDKIKSRGLAVIDTTCPNVRHAQEAARELNKAGFSVIIFGEALHPEVKGLMGWAGEQAMATMNVDDLSRLKYPEKLGILSQTTQNEMPFKEFIKGVINLAFPFLQELRVVNTLCHETKKRQEAALKLAKTSDMVIVVGGLNSANTKHLAEICTPLIETHHIEHASELKRSWLSDKRRIGITAGASTPKEAIDEVITALYLMQQ